MGGRLAWVACSALLLSAARAAACPAIARTYKLESVVPAADAVGVPLNTPLFIPLVLSPPGALWNGRIISNAAPLTELSTGAEVPVGFDSIGPANGGALTLVPGQALKPNTTYVVDLGDPPPQAADAGLPLEPTWQFTTGDALQAPLRLKGELSVTFEPGTDPVFTCAVPSLCGPCAQTSEKSVTKARVELPAGFDGFANLGVQGELEISEDVPAGQVSDVVGSAGVLMLVAGEPGEAVVSMPMRQDGAPYAPCFAFTLIDARHDRATTKLCLDAFPLPAGDATTMNSMGGQQATGGEPAGGEPAMTGDATQAGGGESSTDAAKGSTHRARTSAACSYAPAHEPAGPALALLAGALTLARKRRSKPAFAGSAGAR
jgi:hypothetical protein